MHSAQRSRFASVGENRRFYAEDWGVPATEVDAMMEAKRVGRAGADERRAAVAELGGTGASRWPATTTARPSRSRRPTGSR